VSRQFKKKQVIALPSSRYIVIPDLELLSAVVNRNRTLTKAKAVPLPGELQQHIRAMEELPT